jgi:hypothetical protein
MAKNKMDETSTFEPESSVELPYPKIDEAVWTSLGETAMTLIDINLGNRSALDRSLDLWNAMYEMRIEERDRDAPWENAANICVPLIPSELEEFVSRIAGSAILPRPFSVRGNDPESQSYAHQVEQFYNGEYVKNKWQSAFRSGIHLSARDGVGITEILWDLTETEREIMSQVPDQQGNMSMQKQRIKMVKYDAPRLESVELRDLLLIPAYSTTIDSADAVCRKKYMGEQDLLKLVKAGIADAERVEQVLSFVSTAQGDLSYDRQGTSTYQINNRIDVVDVAVAPPDGVKMNRGPVEIWVIYTNQYDLDGDGVPEENMLWVHDRSRMLVAYCPFPYWQGRPFKPLAVFPRPNRFYGFSLVERLRGLSDEINAQHNSRLDLLDWATNPTVMKDPSGVRIRGEEMSIGPGTVIDGKPGSVAFLPLPDVPPANMQEEQMLIQYASRITGAPQTAGNPPAGSINGGGQQRSARAAQQQAAVQGMQTNMVISLVREWMLEIFDYIHGLYKQYGKNQMESVDQSSQGVKKVVIPKEVLCLDYTLGIAGMGGPLDKENRRNDMMMLANFLMQTPLMQGNLERIWAMASMIVETYDIPEVTRLIGTQDEAKQQAAQQAQAAQQQQQQQMVLAAMNHGKVSPSKQQGPPGQPHP